jgi:hypothetical protein
MVKVIALLGAATLVAACQGEPVEDLANRGSDVEAANGLTSNGLTSNGLTSNGLTSNGLTSNGLAASRLTATTLAALRDKTATGDLTRIFFRYLVSCALPAGHDVSYTWIDAAGAAHTEAAAGAFGLAPGWEIGAVDLTGEEWVSGCLFARTNALGVTVPISIRGNGPMGLAVTPQERMDYSYGEGAFWGNLFVAAPVGFSCSRSAFRVGATTSADLQKGRTCASQGCGMITYVGPCYVSTLATTGQACFQHAANNDWVGDCNRYMSTAQTTYTQIISTWLRP